MTGRFECKQHPNPYFALGVAVDMFQSLTPFINFSFKAVANDLSGQISRKHYLVTFENGNPVGYVGWYLTTKEIAEKWAYQNYIPKFEEGLAGECLVGLYFHAKSKAAVYYQAQFVRRNFPDKICYWKRIYPNGKTRIVTLNPLIKS